MVFSSSLCLAWTEKPLTKPETLEVFVCLALVSCWAPAQRSFFLLRVPHRSIRKETPKYYPKDKPSLSPCLLESTGADRKPPCDCRWIVLGSPQPHFGKRWAPWVPAKSMRAAGGVETQAANNFQHTTVCPSLLSVPISVFLFHSYPI